MNINKFKIIQLLILLTCYGTMCLGQSNSTKVSSFIYQSVLGCKDKNCGNEELKTGMIVLDLSKKQIVLTGGISASTDGLIYTIEKSTMIKQSGKEVLRIDAVDSDKDKTVFMIYKSDNTSSDFTLKSKFSDVSSIVMCYEVSSGKNYYFYCH